MGFPGATGFFPTLQNIKLTLLKCSINILKAEALETNWHLEVSSITYNVLKSLKALNSITQWKYMYQVHSETFA